MKMLFEIGDEVVFNGIAIGRIEKLRQNYASVYFDMGDDDSIVKACPYRFLVPTTKTRSRATVGGV